MCTLISVVKCMCKYSLGKGTYDIGGSLLQENLCIDV